MPLSFREGRKCVLAILSRHVILLSCLLSILVFRQVRADEPESNVQKISIEDRLPYGQQPIDYLGSETENPLASLKKRLEDGQVNLKHRKDSGYLLSLLEALEIPVESQLLVFSKTSVNRRMVEPKRPRAIYFNDQVSVAWLPDAPSLELSAVDPQKGSVFYILHQDMDQEVRLLRRNNCLACHAGSTTIRVPGPTVRSFLTDKRGKPLRGYSRVTHKTELEKRWGGWYVTGKHGRQSHLGNLVGRKDNHRHQEDESFGGNVTNLKPYFDVSRYPSPHSDLVAHLVLNHQSHGYNLITRVNYESRLNRRSDAEERLLRYLLFVDEAPLKEPVQGTSGFAQWFASRGPQDEQGRSLRDLNLKNRLFKYRLSYLIYSPAFAGLPEEVKSRLYRQLWQILTGQDKSEEYRHLSAEERQAILNILCATKDDLPSYWKQSSETES